MAWTPVSAWALALGTGCLVASSANAAIQTSLAAVPGGTQRPAASDSTTHVAAAGGSDRQQRVAIQGISKSRLTLHQTVSAMTSGKANAAQRVAGSHRRTGQHMHVVALPARIYHRATASSQNVHRTHDSHTVAGTTSLAMHSSSSMVDVPSLINATINTSLGQLPATPPAVLGSGSSTGSVTPASQNAIPANDLNVNAVVAPTNDLIGQMPHVTNPDAMVADLLRTHASSPSLPQADSLSLHAELAGMNVASANCR